MDKWDWMLIALYVVGVLMLALAWRDRRVERRRRMDRDREWLAKHGHRSFRR